jgi:hypothetical protein
MNVEGLNLGPRVRTRVNTRTGPFDCAIWRVPQHVGGSDILHYHRLRNFDFLRRHNCVTNGAFLYVVRPAVRGRPKPRLLAVVGYIELKGPRFESVRRKLCLKLLPTSFNGCRSLLPKPKPRESTNDKNNHSQMTNHKSRTPNSRVSLDLILQTEDYHLGIRNR